MMNRPNYLNWRWVFLLLTLTTNFARADEIVKEQHEPCLLGLPRSEFQSRRDELKRRLSEKGGRDRARANTAHGNRARTLVLLCGGVENEIDTRFRQSNIFAYLTGVDIPNAFLVLDLDQDRETLYLPSDTFHGSSLEAPRRGPDPSTAKHYGVDRAAPTSALLGDLFTSLADPLVETHETSRSVVYLLTSSNGREALLERLLREGAPNTDYRDIRSIVAEMRKVKSPNETKLLNRAIAITEAAQRRVIDLLRPGVFEYELEGAIVGMFLAEGANRAGFPSIVGSGPNSTIPHYFANQRRVGPGELVVIDIGAEYQYYTADLTRTYPSSGRFTARQRELYQLVLDAQRAVEAEMKPGKTRLADMTRFTREFFRKSPLRAKDERGQEQTMDHFFIHGLGHYLGMEVHDVGSYAEPVQTNEIFTIEPGLYIRSENLGIRIEDDYIMTETGARKLSSGVPSTPDEIEALLARARDQARPSR